MSPAQEANPSDERKIWPEQVLGGKYVRILEKQLLALRQEDAHGNQQLFLDDVFVVYLLAFFNPTIRSLRTIEDFSQTVQAQRHLSVEKVCKSTLSDFNQLSDPARLQPIITALRAQLDHKIPGGFQAADGDLATLLQQTIAVDGTYLPALADVAWALKNRNNHATVRYRARLDVQLNVTTWLPDVIVVPEVGQSEANSAILLIQDGKLYLYDRGYMSYDLLRAHYQPAQDPLGELEARASFVFRYKANGNTSPVLSDAQERPLTDADRAAGVIRDRTGYFHSGNANRSGVSRILVREVEIEVQENGQTTTVRLITNLFDISAKDVGVLYRQRWQVELFFRWLKSYGHFGHLISHAREGVLTHFYVTIIGALLMYLHTGHRPSKYLFALVNQVAMGSATLEEILPILRERERRSELDRQSRKRRQAKQKP